MPQVRVRRGSSPFLALRHPRFRAVWAAQSLSMLGFWLQTTARAYLVYEATGSAVALGAVYLASYGPQLLVSPWSGVIADRWDRRRVVLVTTSGLLLVAVATALLAATGRATVPAVLTVSVLGGVLLTLQTTSAMALLPALVPRTALSSAVGLQAVSVSATRVVGPLLAGALLPLTGPAWLFVGQAVTLIPVMLVWGRVPLPARTVPPSADDRGLSAITAGLRHVLRTPELRVPIGLLAVMTGIGYVHQPLALAFATEALSGGDAALGVTRFGMLQAAVGVGSLVGVLATSTTTRPALAALGTGAVLSAALVGLGLSGSVPVALAVAALLGAAHFAHTTLAQVLAQHHAPEQLRGRVMAVTQLAVSGLFPFTAVFLGRVAEAFGTPRTYVVCGLVCLGTVLLAIPFRRHLRLPVAALPVGPAGVERPLTAPTRR